VLNFLLTYRKFPSAMKEGDFEQVVRIALDKAKIPAGRVHADIKRAITSLRKTLPPEMLPT
jgi:hypothetical protein